MKCNFLLFCLILTIGFLFSETVFSNISDVDLTFSQATSIKGFTIKNGEISHENQQLRFDFEIGAVLTFPSLEGSRNEIYNPHLENRNTMFFVMRNNSNMARIKISFITKEDPIYTENKSKVFEVEQHTQMQAFYFNFSDLSNAHGQLIGLKIEPINARGTLLIDRISFEEETPLASYAGKITSCKSEAGSITIQGSLQPEALREYTKLSIYETTMATTENDITKMNLVVEKELDPHTYSFSIKGISLQKEKEVTHLSSQFLAVLKGKNGYKIVAPRFYIENWRDFETNPYAFTIPTRTIRVIQAGAQGDGFTDDTKAIQKAIDSLANQGGGRVVLSGDNSLYGKRYVATNIKLRSNINLHIEEGATLWQSQNEADYSYKPAYGHDGTIPGINWTHNMHVANLPLIQGSEVENIKITGNGKIRSWDVESTQKAYEDYRRHCDDRIHVIPIGLWKCKNIEVTDVEIIRSNNYHTAFYSCENIFIGNIKMHEVKCVSGDGIGLGMGTHNVKIVRVFLESNDDGVVLWSSYNDPRGLLWWHSNTSQNNSIYNVTVCHSCIHSGGGKAIAIIPWGTDNPNQEHQEIYNINVYDNRLQGGYSVGTWPDNPYNGEQPFTNEETNDYSPVKEMRIYNNIYESECNLLCIKPTNVITDCGIHSSEDFINDTFKQGHSYWSIKGNALISDQQGFVNKDGQIYQGLYLKRGYHSFIAEIKGKGNLFIQNVAQPNKILKKSFSTKDWATSSLYILVEEDDTYYLGIEGKDAIIRQAHLEHSYQ